MTASIPTTEPAELRAGDTWAWTKTLDDYPASAWTLKYRFKNAAGGFEITATASGDDFSVSVAAATTTGYAAGAYSWMAWVEGGTSEKYTVDTGTCTINPDYRSGTATAAFDDRTHARIVLDAIEAVIEGRAAKDQEEYEIAGRRLKHTPIPTLLKLRQHYKAEVAGQVAAEAVANGLGTGRRIQFRI
jgi:hypothetical protein